MNKDNNLSPGVNPSDSVKPKALVVDDIILNLKVIAAMLRELDFEVLSASSGDEALDLLEQHSFDMIFTDLWMPNMNGKELLREIKLNPKNRNSIICAVTADTECGSDFAENDFAAIILKPVTLDKLRLVINSKDKLLSTAAKPMLIAGI